MKRIAIIIIVLAIAINVSAQCYQPNVDKGNAALANGKYAEAYDYYTKATKCPDAGRFNNGQEAKDNMKKCLPVLTIEGKTVFEINVGPEAGEHTFNVQSDRIRMWLIDGGVRRQGINVSTNITRDSFRASWDANPTNAPRDLTIRLYGVDGVKDIDAKVIIHQAAGGIRINGKTNLEYNIPWEGNVVRCDVTGISDNQKFQIKGIDTSWISIQKHDSVFFIIVKSNNDAVSHYNKITVLSNNQSVIITIKQSGCENTYNPQSKARIPLGNLRIGPQTPVPIKVSSKAWQPTNSNSGYYKDIYCYGYLNAQGEVIGLGDNHRLYDRYGSNYSFFLKDNGISQINNSCFVRVSLDSSQTKTVGSREYVNRYYTAVLYSYRDKKLIALGKYHCSTGEKYKSISIHKFKNDDFAIYCINDSVKTIYRNDESLVFTKVFYQYELFKGNGQIIKKGQAHFAPDFYEDGIVLTDEWTDYSKKKDKTWFESYVIRRNGTKVNLPKDAEDVSSISNGIIRFSKESRYTSEGIHLREYGYCDMNGNTILKPKYFHANDFFEGLAIVSPPQKLFCFIDKAGNEKFHNKYAFTVRDYSEGWAMVSGGDYPITPTFIDKTGIVQLSLESFSVSREDSYKLYQFHDGVAIARERYCSKYCLINKKGEKIIDSIFDDATIMHSGLAGIYKNKDSGLGRWGIINKKGTIIVPPRCANPPQFNNDGSAMLIYEDCVLTIDSSGNVFDGTAVKGIEFTPTTDSLYIFAVNGIYGYYDNTFGIISIPPRFKKALPFSENLAAVQVGSKWGFIDRNGVVIIPTVFESVEPFVNGYAIVTIDGKKYRIDKQGMIFD